MLRAKEHPMIDHTGIGVSDMARSAVFYDAALKALGLSRVAQMPSESGKDGIGYGYKYPIFWIDRLPSRPKEFHLGYRVVGGGRPPPTPTERGVRISRTTLFGSWFTAFTAICSSFVSMVS
jgi:catechol 2,3-dioxygenase-like lactoylglutathione lyase family enzyme